MAAESCAHFERMLKCLDATRTFIPCSLGLGYTRILHSVPMLDVQVAAEFIAFFTTSHSTTRRLEPRMYV